MRIQEGRAALRASNPSCELRGINGRQLARLSTVFLAFPEEDEQSVCAGRGASAAQPVLAGSRVPPPGSGSGKADAEGGGLRPRTAASWAGRGPARGPLAQLGRPGGGEEVGEGRWRGRDARGAGAQARVPPNPKSTCLFRLVLFLARYWEDFHSCTVTALTDCQEGAKDMWDKLRKESKNLNIQGSLFELCGSGNGAAGSPLPALPVLLVSLSAALATWLSF